MKNYLWILFCLLGQPLDSAAATLEEQADAIEATRNNARKEIFDIFNKYKNSIKVTTGEPTVINSDGEKVVIGMKVFVKLMDVNISSQLSDVMNKYFSYPRKFATGDEGKYVEVSIVSGGDRDAWNELTKNGLKAEVLFLKEAQSIPLFGNFDNWFTVKITESEVLMLDFMSIRGA